MRGSLRGVGLAAEGDLCEDRNSETGLGEGDTFSRPRTTLARFVGVLGDKTKLVFIDGSSPATKDFWDPLGPWLPGVQGDVSASGDLTD